MQTTYIRGHKVIYRNKQWIFEDTGKLAPTPQSELNVKCGFCGRDPVDKQDYCIKDLPGVVFACCGHGVEKGYIRFENGVTIRGRFNVETPQKDYHLKEI